MLSIVEVFFNQIIETVSLSEKPINRTLKIVFKGIIIYKKQTLTFIKLKNFKAKVSDFLLFKLYSFIFT